jgi:hypothetical protein
MEFLEWYYQEFKELLQDHMNDTNHYYWREYDHGAAAGVVPS